MPSRMTFEMVPAGVSLTSALDGEEVEFSSSACLTSEDGNTFLSHIEAVWNFFAPAISQLRVSPSQVDHLLVLIDQNRQAVLYLNELKPIASGRPKKAVQAGQEIFKDDIATVESFAFCDSAGALIDIPPDHGLVVIFSVGWRKCLCYDFNPILDAKSPPRSLDLPKLFERVYRSLLFQEMYSITEDQWAGMFKWGWFPFVWMTADDRKKVICFSNRAKEPRPLFEEICRRFKPLLPEKVESWKRLDLLKSHLAFIEKAAEHYAKDDFLSAIQCLFPRLEGIMRSIHLSEKPGQKAQQRTMAETLVEKHSDYSLLLPARFREYLKQVYFRAFDEATGDMQLSRNTVGHGVSLPEDCDLVRASLGFMTLDQMFYFLVPLQKP